MAISKARSLSCPRIYFLFTTTSTERGPQRGKGHTGSLRLPNLLLLCAVKSPRSPLTGKPSGVRSPTGSQREAVCYAPFRGKVKANEPNVVWYTGKIACRLTEDVPARRPENGGDLETYIKGSLLP